MAKMKLTKDNKKNAATRGKSGIPNWLLTTIVLVVIAAVLLTCLLSFAKSSGVVMRMGNAMKSEDYKVSGSMMNYFYANTYTNFTATYESYMSYLSIGKAQSMADHDDIVIGGTEAEPNTYDTAFFSDYKGKTWKEYFLDQTVTSVKAMLVYCEEADVLGITLDEEDEKTIEDAIDTAVAQFRIYNMSNGGGTLSESACLSAMYGEGMKRGDIRKAMELSTLATKCSEHIYETVEAAVGDDRINAEYDANKNDYDLVDYIKYSFDVDYDDAVEKIVGKDAEDSEIEAKKDAILAEYKDMIAKAKAKAEALAACTELEAFKAYILTAAAEDDYDELYAKITFAEADKVAADSEAVIKAQIIASVVKDVTDGADKATDMVTESTSGDTKTYKIGTVDVTEKFATEIRTLKDTLFTNTSAVIDDNTGKKVSYKADDEFSEWAFAADRAVNDIKSIVAGDGSGEGEITVDKKYYTADVYFMLATRYKNETPSRDVAYMLFSSTTDAEKAITKLKEQSELNKDKFADIAKELSAEANTVWEDYVEGQMSSASFDEWLFDATTKVGAITEKPVTMSDGSIMVAYYVADGDVPTWRMNVKTALVTEDVTAREDEMTKTHSGSVTSTQWILDRVGK